MIRALIAAALMVPQLLLAAELEIAPTQGGPVIAPVRLETPLTIPTLGELPNLGAIQNVELNANVLAAGNVATASILPAAAAASANPAIYTAKGIIATSARTTANAQSASGVTARGTLGSVQAAMDANRSETPVEARLETLFENGRARSDDSAAPTLAGKSSRSVPLAKSRPSVFRRLAPKIAAAALVLATPAMAFAQAADGPGITAAHSLSLLSGIHPLASAAGAVLGAAIGLIVSRPKDGSEPSAGDILANVLRYGVIGGAGVYALLDITRIAFVGPTVGLVPLAAAVATAALGRTAFPKKFADQATTSADRVVGAFPAVAAALGLTVGVSLAPVAMPLQVAAFAMSVTGLATAVYSAVFKPGRSPAEGPDNFGKGYVMQALFSGLALALSGWLVYPFAALAAGGFLLTLWTLGKELWSLLPKPPAPPAPKA